ncbi:MAG: ribose 5-phosphate isomerase B [bacterium]
MNIAIGSDHAGLDLKDKLKEHIESTGVEVRDFGASGPESVDYPDYAFKVGEAVARGECEFGVLVCSTGIGIAVAANKVKGIRAGLVCNVEGAVQSRSHVDCNVLVFGQRFCDIEMAKAAYDAFIKTPFEGGRHERRVGKIKDYESR